MMKRLFVLLYIFCATVMTEAQTIAFKGDITGMSPMSYPHQSGLSGFTLEMRNDSAFVHLPYMGQVYNPTFNNEGINYDEPYEGLKIKDTKKKDGKKISFKLKHDFVTYRFDLTLWNNNSISIFMQPSNAQGCDYIGEYVKL